VSEQDIIRVMIVDDITETRENLKKLLLFERGVEVVGAAASGEEGIALGKQLRPDVVLMDINMPGIDGISAGEILTREVPGLQIIMMSVQGEADYLRRSMLAGAREFLIKPFSADELITSIRRVYELGRQPPLAAVASRPASPGSHPGTPYANTIHPATPQPPPTRTGRIIAAFGAKGGVGTSTLIANLAIALQEVRKGTRIALLDGDFQFGDIGVLLNLNRARSIIDLCEHIDELDAQFIADVMTNHPSGLKVLLAPPSPEMADLITIEHLKSILAALRDHFDYVLIDTPTSFGESTLTLLDGADIVLLITTPEIPAIKNATLFFDVSEQLKYDEEKVLLLLNKYDPRTGITAEAIRASIKHPIFAAVSREDRIVNTAINQGLPFVLTQPRSQVSLDVVQLAKMLVAVPGDEPALTPAVSTAAPQPVKKRSLFGKLLNR